MSEIFLGNPPANIIDWIEKHSQSPSPYFTYDSNRVITGLHQGEPNIQTEDGWTYGGGSDLIENYATTIGDYAFNDFDYSVDGIPPSKAITGNITFQNVTSIMQSAFDCCSNLTNVAMPNVAIIKNSAFSGCSGLTSMTIGSNIETIGDYAFDTCGSPITLTIGKPLSWVETRYEKWNLPSGSTIVCTDNTITV